MSESRTTAQAEVIGTVRGDAISLDAPLPDFEGRRVRVVLTPAEQVMHELSDTEQEGYWQHWAQHGPQGPLRLDDDWPADA